MQVKMPVGVLVFCHDGGKYSLNVLFGAPRSISGAIKKKNRAYQGGGGGVGGEWEWEVADNFDLVLKMHPHFKTLLINLAFSPNPGIQKGPNCCFLRETTTSHIAYKSGYNK